MFVDFKPNYYLFTLYIQGIAEVLLLLSKPINMQMKHGSQFLLHTGSEQGGLMSADQGSWKDSAIQINGTLFGGGHGSQSAYPLQ